MKKIVIASDSFKGSLDSMHVAESVERGIRSVIPQCEIVKLHVADGGEGTVAALTGAFGGRIVETGAHDPLMRPIVARYGISTDGATAFIETASASGLALLKVSERNPMKTTTYGTGEMIADALKKGCRKFIVGIGGSATNDGGTGMLRALGFRFIDNNGLELQSGGEILGKIDRIDDSVPVHGLGEAEFKIACDVNNPLIGPSGAAYVFASQKGADEAQTRELDRGLENFAGAIKNHNGRDIKDVPGAGAAGGLGGGFIAFLNAELISGVGIILDTVKFDENVKGADLVITGEGRLDAQTIMGKLPQGVLQRASKAGIPVIAIGGSVEKPDVLRRYGFKDVFAVTPPDMPLEEALKEEAAKENIEKTARRIMLSLMA